MTAIFSKHALAQLERRGINTERVLSIIASPDFVTTQNDQTRIYSKLVTENSKCYLYRVFVNYLKEPALVITAYKTSKIEKYGYKI
ncbi:MAG: DUF4258 domain-containing protein [Mangrovibacterium sp.]